MSGTARNTCRLRRMTTSPPRRRRLTPQFEVMYMLSGCDAAGVETLRRSLDRLGESVAIATTAGAGQYSVHVHADDAGAAVEAALSLGTLSRIQITSLTGAASTRPSGGWARERAVLAVVDGSGAEELFAGEGAQVLRTRREPTRQRQRSAPRAGQHGLGAGHGAAERVRRRRRTRRGLHRRHRLGHRRGAGADGVDGAGSRRAGHARGRSAGRR